MKKSRLILLLALMLTLLLTSCGHEHSYDEWTVEKDATCTETGTKIRICECGEKETDIILAKGHNEGEWITDAEATCTEDGSKHQVCSVCTATIKKDIILSLGHDWIEATCTDSKMCKICDITEGAASGHDWMEATCTDPKICKTCDTTEGTALEHDWTEATYTAPKTCLTCGTTEGDVKAYTKGLRYGSCMWGDGYSVWGIGTATDIEDIIIPDTYNGKPIIEIYENAFINCKNIKSVSIPQSVLEIGNSAFSGCTSLETVFISNGVTSIASKAFYNCDSLEQISIPDSIEMISKDSFENCGNLKYNTFDNGLYLGDKDTPYFVLISANPCEQLTINSKTEIIAHNALRDNIHIKNVIISDSVRYIGRYAFMGCTNLTNITFGNGLERIYINAFKNCESLKSAVFAPNHTWGVSKYGYNTSRTPIETDDDSSNAKNLTGKYCDYWWGNEFAP